MKTFIFIMILALQKVHCATTLLTLSTYITSLNKSPEPLSINDNVVISLTYDDGQVEDFESPTSIPSQQALNAAISNYTITNGSAVVHVGAYTWVTTSFIISIANDMPSLIPQDQFNISFEAPPPSLFASLGYTDVINRFSLGMQNYSLDGISPMNFLSSTSLPKGGTSLNVNLIDDTLGRIDGSPGISMEDNWSVALNTPFSIIATSIPEPQSSIFIMLSALILAHIRRKTII